MTVLSASLRKDCGLEERAPLIEILTATRSLECSDSRDKIYSLIGTVQHKGKTSDESQPTATIPDYTTPVRKLFAKWPGLQSYKRRLWKFSVMSGGGRTRRQTRFLHGYQTGATRFPCLVLARLDSDNPPKTSTVQRQ
ncbi:hypothetical protein LTS15_010372 [Exophiala xenobiotica]|nr:hypothetical protein LTS15_010372 [Exophiala xenobiotica]